jgi:hypothetical protein
MNSSVKTLKDHQVLLGNLYRQRRMRVKFVTFSPMELLTPVRRPAQVAHMLALAHHIQGAIDRGDFEDRADVARHLNLTRARITQVLDLILLAPDLQEAVLDLEAVDGVEPFSEHVLRSLARPAAWAEQRSHWPSRLNHR